MKSSAWYNKLWQARMQELPIQGDENAAWQKMQGLLDKEMPVTPSSGGTAAPAKPWWLGLTFALIVIIIALLYYAGGHLRHHTKHNIKTGKPGIYNNKNTVRKNNITANNLSGNKLEHNNLNVLPAGANNTAGRKTTESNDNLTKNSSSGFNSSVSSVGGIQPDNKRAYSSDKKHGASLAVAIGPGSQSSFTKKNNSKNKPVQTATNDNVAGPASNNYLDDPKALSKTVTGDDRFDPAKKNNAVTSAKRDSATFLPAKTGSTDTKQTAKTNTGTTNISKSTVKNASASKNSASKFQLGLKIGVNTNGSFTPSSQNIGKLPVDAFLGISGSYSIGPKFGLEAGINVLSPKVISGNYSNSNINYTTLNDSNKQVVHNTGKLTIHGSEKVYNVEIPLLATYKASNLITIQAGPVIGIPVKHNAIKTTLTSISITADTTAAAELKPYLNSTKINNNLNISLSGGVRINLNKFYFDAGYLQGVSPYTISSGLGSGKSYYHTFQFGIGYKLFKSKGK